MYNDDYKKPKLVDQKPTRTLKKLHKKITVNTKKGFAIGHEDATAYGIGWKHADQPSEIKSDVNEVSGDFPAVYGFDISKIELDAIDNIDGVPFNTMRILIVDAYSKGGLITMSWHADNPSSNGDSWDKTAAVKDIIGTGKHVVKYNLWLQKVANYIKTLKYRGKLIPIIFRPFHEMNGSWFWWGKNNCTPEEYIQLWKETVYKLKDKHKLHNLLYTYSPNSLNPDDHYLTYYPGDDFVDILGVDIYDRNNKDEYIRSVKKDLAIVKKIAESKGKLYAFTETGLEALVSKNWFTEILYPNIENSGISWVLFWRNANKKHHYMPYKEHRIAADFKAFLELPKTLFLKDITRKTNK